MRIPPWPKIHAERTPRPKALGSRRIRKVVERINVTGMQGDRNCIKPALEKYFPAALEWPHNWTVGEIISCIGELSKGRTSKIKSQAIDLLEAKLADNSDLLETYLKAGDPNATPVAQSSNEL